MLTLSENVAVIHNSVDITNKVIKYSRDHTICNGIATLELEIEWKSSLVFHPWDEIVIYENGDKKGTFYVDTVGKDATSGLFSVTCQDNSKRASDYFITDSYNVDAVTYADYWIRLFLDEAGIDYTFTEVDSGAIIAPNCGLGFDSVHNIVIGLLQQSGWYIYYNPNGRAIIGHLNKSISSADHSINDANILNIVRERDDSRLRNRAVVWGSAVPELGTSVFVDISINSPYDIDSNDKRTVVFASGSLYDYAEALEIAHQMLNEFSDIKDEKLIVCTTDADIRIGDVLKVESAYWSGNGLVTGIEASVSNEGLVYTVTLDEKCPRLFAYFGYYPPIPSGGWVYTGHWGDGIWKKHTESPTWYDSSTGLENLFVKDLFIQNEVFAAITDDGYLYTRSSENGSWSKYSHGSLRDSLGISYTEDQIKAEACSINDMDNIIAGYNTVSGVIISGYKSWVLELNSNQDLIKAEEVTISGGAFIIDLESTGEYNIISVESPGAISGYVYEGIQTWFNYGIGNRSIQYFETAGNSTPFYNAMGPDSQAFTYGTDYGHSDISRTFGHTGDIVPSPLIYDNFKNYWYATNIGISKFEVDNDGTTPIVTNWAFTEPSEVAAARAADYTVRVAINQRSSSIFDLVYFWYYEAGYEDGRFKFCHYTYTLGNSSTTKHTEYELDLESGYPYLACAAIVGNNFVVPYWETHPTNAKKMSVIVYNLTSSSLTDSAWIDLSSEPNPDWIDTAFMFANDGDGIILVAVYTIPHNVHWTCFIVPYYYYHAESMDVYAETWRIDRYGSTSAGIHLLEHFDTIYPDHGLSGGTVLFETWGTYGAGAVDVLTNKVYARLSIAIGDDDGCTGSDWHHGRSIVLELPSCSFVYRSVFEHPNEPGYVVYPDEYGIDWYYFDGSESGSSIVINHPIHSRFRGPYWMTQIWFPEYFGGNHFWSIIELPGYNVIKHGTGDPPDEVFTDLIGSQMEDIFNAWWFSNYPGIPFDIDYVSKHVGADNYFRSLSWSGTGAFMGPVGNALAFRGSSRWGLSTYSMDYIYNIPQTGIFKHTSRSPITGEITASDASEEQTMGVFETILNTEKRCKVEISSGAPTVVYSIPVSELDLSSELAITVSNEVGSFYTHSDPRLIYNSRVFDLEDPSSFPTLSGTFEPGDFQRFIGITNNNLDAVPFDCSTPWVTITSGTGIINQMETSNYTYPGPYMFYTVSGLGQFFQKNPYESIWRDYSAGFPESDCTIIRMDDII